MVRMVQGSVLLTMMFKLLFVMGFMRVYNSLVFIGRGGAPPNVELYCRQMHPLPLEPDWGFVLSYLLVIRIG